MNDMPINATNDAIPEALKRMTRDIRAAASTLSDNEARYLVDAYYMMQEDRIRSNDQERKLGESGEPNLILGWLARQSEMLEQQIKGALDRYSQAHIVGDWMRGQKGIGPVIGAGLLAHIDIEKAVTVGHIWRYAGLDHTVEWKKGEKRPWNATLKTLCWKIGESFVKLCNDEDAYYGRIYIERKEYEWKNNLAGKLAPEAERALSRRKFGAETDARVWYEGRLTVEAAKQIMEADAAKRMGMAKKLAGEPGSGVRMLPPAHIHARAKRYAVKLFLAHLHEVWRTKLNLPVPMPFPIAHLGHAHKIEPPAAI